MEACSAHPDLLAVPLSETSLKDSLSQIPLITTWQSLTSLSQRDLESSSSTDTSLHSSSCPGSSSPTLLLSCGSILPSAWIHGDPTEPLFQAHEVNPGYWVIRFSKRLDYEGNFVFFIIGKDRAILFDTGPVESSILPTIILPTLFSLTTQTDYGVDARWRKDRSERENNFHEEYERFEWKGKSLADFDLIVAHTHSHGDHVAGDAQWERLLLAREQSTLHSNCVNTAFKNDCAISTTRNEDWIPMVKAWKSISFIKHSVDSIVEFSGMRLCSFTDSGVSSPQSHSLSNPPLHSSSPLPLDPSWPISHAGEINLGGGRVLTLLPTPGHCRDHVVIYDPISRHLITGDHIYPGRLYVRDYQAFQRRYAFSRKGARRFTSCFCLHILVAYSCMEHTSLYCSFI